MSLTVKDPYAEFRDTDGDPLNNGYVYIGSANNNPEVVGNQLNVYSDTGLTVPVAQPIRTLNGRLVNNSGSPINLQIAESDYSITVRNKNSSLISSLLSIQNLIDSLHVSYTPAGTGAQATNVRAKLREWVSVTDFGATGDGVTDDLDNLQRCADFVGSNGGGTIWVPDGDYYISTNNITGVSQFGWTIRYSNVRIVFESKDAKIISDNTILQKAISITSDVNASSPASTLTNIEITGGSIDGQNAVSGAVTNESAHGIDCRNAQFVKIHNMNIVDCRGDGMYIAYGCEHVWVFNNYIDGNAGSTISGVRQGIAVLSGRNTNIYDNHIEGVLIGVDLEPDDNQINAGYDYLQRINVHNNFIEDCDSEGIALIAPLATQSLTTEDINISENQIFNVDEAVIDVTLESATGSAKRVSIVGNQSDGSNTFKGIVFSYVDGGIISKNNIPDNPDIGLHVINSANDLIISDNIITSSAEDACRIQESAASTRFQNIAIANNYFKSSSGDGLQITGAWEAVVTGGSYIGTVSGLSTQGSSVAGTATDMHVFASNCRFECTVNTGYSVVAGADVQKFRIENCPLINASGATYCVFVDSGIPKPAYILHCEVDIAGGINPDTRDAVLNNANPDRVVVIDGTQHTNTTAELEDISSIYNTSSKYRGKQVFNESTSETVFATGTSAGSVWASADGTTAHTPV